MTAPHRILNVPRDGMIRAFAAALAERGKSFLMDCFFESAPYNRKRRVHFHAFMRGRSGWWAGKFR
ncbi:MAG: hypothetical protein Q8L93_01845 [Rhodocyclaceae bacterium]|nr:hypothetical protein [Rhodocyclaceae bacterium]